MADSSYDWFTVPEDIRDTFAQSAMEEAVLAYPNLSIYATAENEYMANRMNHIFKQTVWALTTQVRKGRFVPNDFEIAFVSNLQKRYKMRLFDKFKKKKVAKMISKTLLKKKMMM